MIASLRRAAYIEYMIAVFLSLIPVLVGGAVQYKQRTEDTAIELGAIGMWVVKYEARGAVWC